jgi:hypothetical protein
MSAHLHIQVVPAEPDDDDYPILVADPESESRREPVPTLEEAERIFERIVGDLEKSARPLLVRVTLRDQSRVLREELVVRKGDLPQHRTTAV